MSATAIRQLTLARILLLGVLVIALASPPVAADSTAPLYAKMEQRFTTEKPGAPTGWRFDGALKPTPAGEQVPPQRGVDFVLPAGSRLRPSAVPSCLASDEQIASEGSTACPEASRVGSGEADLFLGEAGTSTVQTQLFSTGRALLMVFTDENDSVVRVVHAATRRNRVTATLPPVPLSGGYEVAVTRFELKIQRAGPRKRPLLRTPMDCSNSKRWRFTYLPRYDEPYGVQRSTSTMRCRLD